MSYNEQLRAFSGVRYAALNLSGCTGLTTLPEGLTVGDGATLRLSGCTGLTTLPEGLTVGDGAALWLSGCTGLTTLPEGLTVGDDATLELSGCTGLTTLPEGLTVGDDATLELSGCTGIPVVGRDARGYDFRRVVCNGGQVYVNAGCRHFTAAQAWEHWPEDSECRALAEMCLM